MFRAFDISVLYAKSMTREELIGILEKFYTKEKQEQYGVLGLRIELI
jgi:ASC-1-like (ASCH) protein